MATPHNAIVYGAALAQSLGLLTGIGEGEEGTIRTGETLTPVIDPYSLSEASLLRAEYLWHCEDSVAAVAAEQGFGGIRCPTASRSIVVVEGVELVGSAASFMILTQGPVNAAGVDGVGQVAVRDLRWPNFNVVPDQGQLASISGADAALVGTRQGSFNIARGLPYQLVLAPGTEFRFYAGIVNVAITVSIWGRLRVVLPGEPLGPIAAP